MIALRGAAMFCLSFALAVAFWGSFAPTPTHQRVNPAVITPGAVSGAACGFDGRVASAVLTDTAGPSRLYTVTCNDGVVTEAAG